MHLMNTGSLITLGQSIQAELEAHIKLLFHAAFSVARSVTFYTDCTKISCMENNAKAPAHAGCHPAGKQLGRERLGGPGRDQAEHVPLLQGR